MKKCIFGILTICGDIILKPYYEGVRAQTDL